MNLANELRAALEEARAYTLSLFRDVDDGDFSCQAHPDFSPLGWHLGHIGVTESFWILQQCKQEPTLSAAYDRFFTPTDNPKPQRIHLPSRAEILSYLETVRGQVVSFLDHVDFDAVHPLLCEGGIFHMLIQHEEQHTETVLLIKQFLATDKYGRAAPVPFPSNGNASDTQTGVLKPCSSREKRKSTQASHEMVFVPGGDFFMGSDDRAKTLDNERPQHEKWVAAFAVDRWPVTNAEYERFVETGGYRNRSLWSEEGWRWREHSAVEQPLHWRRTANGWCEIKIDGAHLLMPEHPVRCVSWYEAEAYARCVGKRLPTEAEWEKAASLNILERRGVVWEWTSTWFTPYPGFVAHPYEGYSVPYFDDRHRVLRGGSQATRPHVKRITFRNWYYPWMREIFAGFRCAEDA
ncbi:MAG: SUMF1/EgtB/PvdO family nonheme iron enzyme [Candidatus Binatia bacterium]